MLEAGKATGIFKAKSQSFLVIRHLYDGDMRFISLRGALMRIEYGRNSYYKRGRCPNLSKLL